MEERQLSKNSIDLFILRFDLLLDKQFDYGIFIKALSKYFDRTEKRMQTNFEVKFTSDKSELNKVEDFDYVLTNDEKGFSMTFSKIQNSFWFETRNYVNRDTYMKLLTEVLKEAQSLNLNLAARRIGMRFINKFNCLNPKLISKIFNSVISKNLKQRLNQNNISRIICQEEFNIENCKIKVQYGVPNKFYPAIINNYDLLLDIDCYIDNIHELKLWTEAIENLNHSAYNAFLQNINPTFINSLK